MKTWLIALSIAVAGAALVGTPSDADARRLGGGKSSGMQRQMPAQPANSTPTPPAQQNSAAAPLGGAAAGTAAAAGKRSWMGPIAGLAAGLGIAALFSHFGMGGALANAMTMLLLALVAVVAIGWLVRRFAGGSARRNNGLSMAGFGSPMGATGASSPAPMLPAALAPATPLTPVAPAAPADAAASGLPGDFDAAGFERVAKLLFIRLQAANDARQLDDLRRFTTPELFASLRLDLQERGEAPQQTDVVQLDARLLDRAQENGQWVASVRFHGLIRERTEVPAEPFDEVWHFVQPLDASRDWAIAGITTTV